MVNLFRSGAVGFIDWLGLFVSLLKDLSQAARFCGVAVGVGVGVTVGVGVGVAMGVAVGVGVMSQKRTPKFSTVRSTVGQDFTAKLRNSTTHVAKWARHIPL